MSLIKGGGSIASFGDAGGAGGGSGGSGDIKQYSGVVGDAGGPVNGASTWTPAGGILIGASQVWVLIQDSVPIYSIGPAPGFAINPGTGTISIAPNIFVTGSPLVGWYKPA